MDRYSKTNQFSLPATIQFILFWYHSYRATTGYQNDQTYTSHSHGWSTGPTSALSLHVLGIQLLTPLGKTFVIAPILSGLKSAKGGYSTSAGWFGVEWNLTTSGVWTVETVIPVGCEGKLVTPTSTNRSGRRLDGGGEGEEVRAEVTVKSGTQTFVFEGITSGDTE
jgi:hypothetical protein